jgi:hypothetical protein
MTPFRILAALAVLAVPAPALAQHSHDHSHPGPAVSGDSPELRAQIEAVRRATERYRDHGSAVRDGYRLFGMEGPLMGEHWYRADLVKRPLDLSRPSTLQYATIGGRKVLVGVAYTLYRRPDEPLPEGFAGDADHWHTHDVARLARAFVADRPFLRGVVDRRIRQGKVGAGEGRTMLTMVHAWIWSDNPDGTFAQEHRALPYLRAGLPAEWAAGAGKDAAQGVALLAAGACADEVKRTDRLAGLGGGQERDLTVACERASAAVRAALSRERSEASVNGAAGGAWRALEAARARILTREQLARIERVLGAALEPHVM